MTCEELEIRLNSSKISSLSIDKFNDEPWSWSVNVEYYDSEYSQRIYCKCSELEKTINEILECVGI